MANYTGAGKDVGLVLFSKPFLHLSGKFVSESKLSGDIWLFSSFGGNESVGGRMCRRREVSEEECVGGRKCRRMNVSENECVGG